MDKLLLQKLFGEHHPVGPAHVMYFYFSKDFFSWVEIDVTSIIIIIIVIIIIIIIKIISFRPKRFPSAFIEL